MFQFVTFALLFIFSLTSLCLQLASINGCDFVRIHFKALNDNGIYFNNNPFVGLGLFEHQTFTGKNTRDWNFDETCQPYNALEKDMFMDGHMSSIKALTISSLALNSLTVLSLVVVLALMTFARGSVFLERTKAALTMPMFCIGIGMLSSASLALQVVALDKIHDENGICDRDVYFPTGWNEDFPFQIYPEYAYFKYFHECKMGPDWKRAKDSIVIGGLVTFLSMMSATVMLLFMMSRHGQQVGDEEEMKSSGVMRRFPVGVKKGHKNSRSRGDGDVGSSIASL